MANSYTSVDDFKNWIPQRYLAELSNDTGGFTLDANAEQKIQDALDWGASIMESKLRVRDDIPIPAVNADNTTNKTLKECVHDLALYRLYNRRGTMRDEVREQFDVQMTWLNDVAMRRANLDLRDVNDTEVTKTTETPVTEGNKSNYFGEDKFTF